MTESKLDLDNMLNQLGKSQVEPESVSRVVSGAMQTQIGSRSVWPAVALAAGLAGVLIAGATLVAISGRTPDQSDSGQVAAKNDEPISEDAPNKFATADAARDQTTSEQVSAFDAASANTASSGGTSRNLVVLTVPSFESAQRLPKSQYLPKDFVLLTGKLVNPHVRNGERMVEFEIDRVLKGDVREGRILTKDEHPLFCFGMAAASSTFPGDDLLVCWLTRTDEQWSIAELHKLKPGFLELFNAVTGDDQAEKLRPRITPHGLDHETVEMIKLFASPEQVDPLMRELIRGTPKLLEPLVGAPGPSYDADWQQRMKLVSYRLTPALDILTTHSKWQDASLIELILPCYEPLMDQGGEGFRFYLNYHLSMIASKAHYDQGDFTLTDEQLRRIRDVLLRETTGLGDRWTATASTACGGLTYFNDTEVIDLLLKEQAKRPIDRGHYTITYTLSQICAHRNPTKADIERAKAAWFATLESLHEEGNLSDHALAKSFAKSFAKSVVGGLHGARLSDAEHESLRSIYEQTPAPWVRETLAWKFAPPKPVAADAKGEAIVYQYGQTEVASFTKDAGPDPAINKKLAEAPRAKMLKLARSTRAAEVVASMLDADIEQLNISYTPLSRELLEAVARLKKLHTLTVYQCDPVDLGSVGKLAELPRLKSIEFSMTTFVTDDGEAISQIGNLPAVEKLWLTEASLTDEHLKALAGLKTLKTLGLTSNQISNDGLRQLADLPKLEVITHPAMLLDTDLLDELRAKKVGVFPRPFAGQTRVWKLAEGKQVFTGVTTGHLQFTAGGTKLAADDTAIGVYDLKTGRREHQFDTPPGGVEWAVSADQPMIVRRNEKQITIDRFGGESVSFEAFDAVPGYGLFHLLPGGKQVAISQGKSIKLLDAATGKLRRELRPEGDVYFSPGWVRASADGKLLACAGNGHAGVWAWRLGDGKQLHHEPHGGIILGFTGGGEALLFTDRDKKQLFALDTETGKSKAVLTFPADSQPLLYAVTDSHFAFAARTRPITVDLYDVKSWRRQRQFRFSPDDNFQISSVTMSADGKLIAVSGNLNHLVD